MKFVLAHPLARRRAMQAVADAPAGYSVTIKEPSRNGDQNAALHALLSDIARTRVWAGKHQSIDTWKRLLTAAWGRASGHQATYLPAIDGAGVDIVFRPTSTLTVRECSDLIEFINAWAAMAEET